MGYSSDFSAQLATDSNPLTRWCSGQPFGNQTEWLTLDLGAPVNVTWFRIEWEIAFATAYDVEFSDTGDAWQVAFSTIDGEGGIEVHRLSNPVVARFFRLVLRKRGLANEGYSIWDWQLHTAEDSPGCGYWNVCEETLEAGPEHITSLIV